RAPSRIPAITTGLEGAVSISERRGCRPCGPSPTKIREIELGAHHYASVRTSNFENLCVFLCGATHGLHPREPEISPYPWATPSISGVSTGKNSQGEESHKMCSSHFMR